MKAYLDKHSIEYPASAPKDDLLKLV
ncbi:hypothetical protein CBF59_04990 [Lactobacillus taiwanensis]|uniref:HeH/LEM domain-containing protein n=1 Tax=Lactobacillus taiwanensis TaxID=508451 RepID=A0A256LCI1_9LACO|nr:hypothetical protein CBF53_07760 [Lactobacillus taiwanensis]OYR91138.1 hypothetical protein CBF70_07205 [Lactobacillus taiwanensis]OYR91877.1 hypothetical protein CBF59_04990 [Lactobacillus taiwanensis]